MKKCDIIIPVYNAPEYVEICIFALINNTDLDDVGTIYLLDDKSNEITANLLDNIQEEYKDKKVKVIHNKENVGFIKNVNYGMSICKSDYIMLLNTDCFVAKNTVKKLMNHMEKDEKIGLICPICSNAANLTLPIFQGFSYMMMDQLLEEKFKGINYDACTIVGNCLMISKKCIDEVGVFDEIYGMGYGDETDYQFQAMEKGFKAKVALDTYVFHKAEVSFNTTDKKRSERLEKNRKIFFDRWGEKYNALLEIYQQNDPIEFINRELTEEDKIPKLDYTFVLPNMGKGAGGVIYISELVNYLSILGMNINVINIYPGNYDGIMIYNPVTPLLMESIKPKYLIATIYDSVWLAKKLSEKYQSKIIYFAQGYEFYFLNGLPYGEVESSYKVVDYVLTISHYLKKMHKDLFGIESIIVPNGISYNLLANKNKHIHPKITIMMNIRNESLKGGFILIDLIKKISLKMNDVKIIVINNAKKVEYPVNNNPTVEIEYIDGPVNRSLVHQKLYESDILLDSSLSEGFGLLPLEAMATGVVPIVSNSLGNKEYCTEKNSFVIESVNDADKYLEKVELLINDKTILEKMSKEAIKTASKFRFDMISHDFYKALQNIEKCKTNTYKVTDKDQELLNKYYLSEKKYKKMLNRCQKLYSSKYKHSNRINNCKILLKETAKYGLFCTKQFIRVIKDKNYKL